MAVSFLRWHEVPADAREPYIHTGYRPASSGMAYSLRSAFQLHNETGNVWTHALPVLYFLYFLLFEHDWWQWRMVHPDQQVILAIYFLGILTLFITSACAHLLSCAGARCWRNVCFGLDYAAITLFGTASALVYFFLLRTSHEGILGGAHNFLLLTFMAAVGAMSTCCWSQLQPYKFLRILRVVAFAAPFIVGSTPAFNRFSSVEIPGNITTSYELILSTCHSSHGDPDFLFGVRYSRHLLFMGMGAFIKAVHFPESFWPGKFDICGHSHQVFHVCIFLAVREQFWMVLGDITHVASQPRIRETLTASSPLLALVTMAALVASMAGIFFIFVLLSLPSSDKKTNCGKQVIGTKTKSN